MWVSQHVTIRVREVELVSNYNRKPVGETSCCEPITTTQFTDP
jgi:hypothetical protein